LNEFASVARRKFQQPWREVRTALEDILLFCPEPVPVTIKTHSAALTVAERYGYGIYDALLIAAAIESSCTILYSEDLHSGQKIQGMTIRNPFAA
jgi:predicted nucleic acid-binding protein